MKTKPLEASCALNGYRNQHPAHCLRRVVGLAEMREVMVRGQWGRSLDRPRKLEIKRLLGACKAGGAGFGGFLKPSAPRSNVLPFEVVVSPDAYGRRLGF